jgi:hypothetical protein
MLLTVVTDSIPASGLVLAILIPGIPASRLCLKYVRVLLCRWLRFLDRGR